jgi:hypothetical protein
MEVKLAGFILGGGDLACTHLYLFRFALLQNWNKYLTPYSLINVSLIPM